jgi:hypothetical protein
MEDFPSIEHLRGCDESVLPYHIERIAGRIEVLLRPWRVDELNQENDIVELNGKSIRPFLPSDRHPLAPLDSANRNSPEKCCRVTSDRVGKKRADTSSPRTLVASSQNDQGHQLKPKKPKLESVKKRLDSNFDASPSDKCFDGELVFCGGIRNQRIQEYAKSSSAEVLKTLISSFSLSKGKSYSHDCEKASFASDLDKWKKTNSAWTCPACEKAMNNLNRKLKELYSLQDGHDNPEKPSQYFEPSSKIKRYLKEALLKYLRQAKERLEVFQQFKEDPAVKECLQVLDHRGVVHTAIKIGPDEIVIVDKCERSGCNKIMVRQQRQDNSMLCKSCYQNKCNKERSYVPPTTTANCTASNEFDAAASANIYSPAFQQCINATKSDVAATFDAAELSINESEQSKSSTAKSVQSEPAPKAESI